MGRAVRAIDDAPKPRRDEEHRLQKALVQHLMLGCVPGVYWTAIPNGGSRSKRTAGRLKAEGVRAGAPDIAIIFGGHFFGLELKTPSGRQSPAQKEAQQQIIRAGGDYLIVRDIDHALSFLAEHGMLKAGYGVSSRAVSWRGVERDAA